MMIGSNVHYYDTVTSTNDIAHQMAREGAGEGTVIFAEQQSNGRGKMGRRWVSPKGEGRLASIILRPDIPFLDAHEWTIMAGVGVAKAIRDTFGLTAMIKWPNDILINGKKVCGILTEASGQGMERVEYLIIGIGINVHSDIASLPEGATSIKAELGPEVTADVDRSGFARDLLRTLDKEYAEFTCSKYREHEYLIRGIQK
jgi:BirA family biotin operon repressor/biotin-[acetyl-CoA-carboxylase] ligase